MNPVRKMSFAVAVVGAAVATTWASAAFACSPAPRVYSVLPESASPGSTVQVEARDVRSNSPVEIRWNGVKGDVMATATAGPNGAFSVPVRVPDVAPGIYAMTLVAPDVGVGRTAFEVTAPAGSAPAPVQAQLWPNATRGSSMASPASNGPNTVGVAVLSMGFMGLAAGSTVAVARRRRVLAGAQSQ